MTSVAQTQSSWPVSQPAQVSVQHDLNHVMNDMYSTDLVPTSSL